MRRDHHDLGQHVHDGDHPDQHVDRMATTTTLPCTTARCDLDRVLAGAACAGDTVPASITKKFDRATTLMDQAGSGSNVAPKLLERARRALERGKATAARAAKRKNPKLSAA